MLYRRNKTWWVRLTAPNGQQIRKSAGTENKKSAEEYEATLKKELFRQARLGEKPRRTWKDAVVRWVEKTAHKASHQDDIYRLREADADLGDLWLDEITAERLDALAQRYKATGVSNATVNRLLEIIRAILNKAERDWGWIDRAPVVEMLPEPDKRIRWLTREESARLIAALDETAPHVADMARFTLATGLREANVTGLEWSQVDLERRVAWVHPDQSKTRRAIGVPLNTDAVLVLRRWAGRHERFVFCYEGRKIVKAGGQAWKRGLKRAGVDDFRWHDLRHTWASWHVQSGTPLHVLQEMGGWTNYATVQRYAHLAPEHLAKHAARIETGLKGISTNLAQGRAAKKNGR